MNKSRISKLQKSIRRPLLIKKKENLFYLLSRNFLNGYLLVLPLSTEHLSLSTSLVFLGDGLEKIDGIRSDFLKNVGTYISKKQTLEVFGEFTYAEVKYIKFKNPKLKIRVNVKHDPVDYERVKKSKDEIALIGKAMRITGKVFEQVRKQLKKKIWTEIALANFIRQAGYRLGAQEAAFPPIVASGANSAVPHHIPSLKKIKAGEPVILDFGFKYKGYCSDFTRTIFLKKVPLKIEKIYNQVEEAYKKCINAAKEGVKAGSLYNLAVKTLAEKKLDKFFIHNLGHGTGLEIHELPNLSPLSQDVLQENMVFSIEPGVYVPKLGGVRIEDLVYLSGKQAKRFISISTDLRQNIF